MKRILLISAIVFLSKPVMSEELSTYQICVEKFFSMMQKDRVAVSNFHRIYDSLEHEEKPVVNVLSTSTSNSYFSEERTPGGQQISPSIVHKKIKLALTDYLAEQSEWQLNNYTEKAKLYTKGKAGVKFLEVEFPDKRTLYFEFNNDSPIQIANIWLDNGNSLNDVINNKSEPAELKKDELREMR